MTDATKFMDAVSGSGSSLKCEVCGQGPQHGVAVFRCNPKGQKGIWRCEPHMETPINAEVKEITDILGEWAKGRT